MLSYVFLCFPKQCFTLEGFLFALHGVPSAHPGCEAPLALTQPCAGVCVGGVPALALPCRPPSPAQLAQHSPAQSWLVHPAQPSHDKFDNDNDHDCDEDSDDDGDDIDSGDNRGGDRFPRPC